MKTLALIFTILVSLTAQAKYLPEAESYKLRFCGGAEGAFHSNGGGFVASTATVSEDSLVEYGASVCERAIAKGGAEISGNAIVSGRASVDGFLVTGNGQVYGNSSLVTSGTGAVFGNAKVFGNARLKGNVTVSEDSQVFGNASVSDNAEVFGSAKVGGSVELKDNASAFWKANVTGNLSLIDSAKVCDDIDSSISGEVADNQLCNTFYVNKFVILKNAYVDRLYSQPIVVNNLFKNDISYTIIEGPENLSMNEGVISWIPSKENIGLNQILIQVFDGIITKFVNFHIEVEDHFIVASGIVTAEKETIIEVLNSGTPLDGLKIVIPKDAVSNSIEMSVSAIDKKEKNSEIEFLISPPLSFNVPIQLILPDQTINRLDNINFVELKRPVSFESKKSNLDTNFADNLDNDKRVYSFCSLSGMYLGRSKNSSSDYTFKGIDFYIDSNDIRVPSGRFDAVFNQIKDALDTSVLKNASEFFNKKYDFSEGPVKIRLTSDGQWNVKNNVMTFSVLDENSEHIIGEKEIDQLFAHEFAHIVENRVLGCKYLDVTGSDSRPYTESFAEYLSTILKPSAVSQLYLSHSTRFKTDTYNYAIGLLDSRFNSNDRYKLFNIFDFIQKNNTDFSWGDFIDRRLRLTPLNEYENGELKPFVILDRYLEEFEYPRLNKQLQRFAFYYSMSDPLQVGSFLDNVFLIDDHLTDELIKRKPEPSPFPKYLLKSELRDEKIVPGRFSVQSFEFDLSLVPTGTTFKIEKIESSLEKEIILDGEIVHCSLGKRDLNNCNYLEKETFSTDYLDNTYKLQNGKKYLFISLVQANDQIEERSNPILKLNIAPILDFKLTAVVDSEGKKTGYFEIDPTNTYDLDGDSDIEEVVWSIDSILEEDRSKCQDLSICNVRFKRDGQVRIGLTVKDSVGNKSYLELYYVVSKFDSGPIEVEWELNQQVTSEGKDIEIIIKTERKVDKDVTVNLEVGGNATPEIDYLLQGRSVTIKKGQSSGSVLVRVLNDADDDNLLESIDLEIKEDKLFKSQNLILGNVSKHTLIIDGIFNVKTDYCEQVDFNAGPGNQLLPFSLYCYRISSNGLPKLKTVSNFYSDGELRNLRIHTDFSDVAIVASYLLIKSVDSLDDSSRSVTVTYEEPNKSHFRNNGWLDGKHISRSFQLNFNNIPSSIDGKEVSCNFKSSGMGTYLQKDATWEYGRMIQETLYEETDNEACPLDEEEITPGVLLEQYL